MVSPLAGLDARDVVSERHPYLHLAGLEEPEAVGADAHLRRLRTARYTPGGLPQPPEVMGVDADARVPNWLQPMSGEFRGDGTEAGGGGEVSEGRPGFWGALMAPPTGVADGVGVGSSVGSPEESRGASPAWRMRLAALDGTLDQARDGARVQRIEAARRGEQATGRPGAALLLPELGAGAAVKASAGAPGAPWMPPQRAGALGAPWMPALRAEPAAMAGPPALAAVPHFADGGELDAGGTGIVGEEGEEAIHALPGGGVQVKPLGPGTPSMTTGAGMKPRFDAARAMSGAGARRNFAGGLGAPAAAAGARPSFTGAASPNAAYAGIAPAKAGTAAGSAAGAAPAGVSTMQLAGLSKPEAKPQPAYLAAMQPELTPKPAAGDATVSGMSPQAWDALRGYQTTAAPPEAHAARDAYRRALGGYQDLETPNTEAAAYHVPGWWRALQLGLDVFAPRVGRAAEPWVEPGEARYERDLDTYQQRGKADLAALPDWYRAATLESGDNKSGVGQWEAATRQTDARRRADDAATYQRGLAQARERALAAEQRAATARAANAQRGDLRTITGSDGAYYSFDPRSGAVTPLVVGGRPLRAPVRTAAAPRAAATKPPTRTQAAESYLSGLGDKLAGMDRGQVQRWLDANPATMRRHGLTAADMSALAAQYGNGAAGQLDLEPAQ